MASARPWTKYWHGGAGHAELELWQETDEWQWRIVRQFRSSAREFVQVRPLLDIVVD
jgi:hypothetical protein